MKRRAPEPKLCHFMTAPPCAHCLHKHFYISQLVSKLWAVARYWATKTFPVGFIPILNLCVLFNFLSINLSMFVFCTHSV